MRESNNQLNFGDLCKSELRERRNLSTGISIRSHKNALHSSEENEKQAVNWIKIREASRRQWRERKIERARVEHQIRHLKSDPTPTH